MLINEIIHNLFYSLPSQIALIPVFNEIDLYLFSEMVLHPRVCKLLCLEIFQFGLTG